MHHLYPLAKGDQMCPLGFHPQVRWPTRCKRCFRDYKEHGGRKKEDDLTSSTPSLTWASPAARGRDIPNGAVGEKTERNWASSTNLSSEPMKKESTVLNPKSSWTSTPDLAAENCVTVSLKLPRRRLTGPLPAPDTGQQSASRTSTTATDGSGAVLLRRPSPSPPPSASAHIIITKNDSLAERVRKMQLIKSQNSLEKEPNVLKDSDKKKLDKSKEDRGNNNEDNVKIKDDLKFSVQVNNNASLTNSKPPSRGGPTTSFNDNNSVIEYQEQITIMKQEIDVLKKRCEKVEKEKSDILLRRLANIDTANKYTTGRTSEVLKLQQKVNDLTTQNQDLKDEKRHLNLKIKEIESEFENRTEVETQTRQIEQLRAKLLAAETLCEELMDENEDMKKELRDLEEEIEEMQDNFREDQADEYSSLRRELEQTIKNCRVLSFKLKKTERKAEQLELEKSEQEKRLLEVVGGEEGLGREERIKELEQEVARSTEVALRLQRELAEAQAQLAEATGSTKPTTPITKPQQTSDKKVSRASLTRGGSQEDPAQLLRDLQDSLEREADLREQLRNAEEEANNLRKTASRVEDDNESLLLQLKKMATKARIPGRKLSPTPPVNRLHETPIEKDEGISDEEDPAELRLLLELNEQESAVLRRKTEELEQDREHLKKQVKELTEKLANTRKSTTSTNNSRRISGKECTLAEEKIKVLEDEIAELRKKLIEKERDCERLHAELTLSKKKPKASLVKSKSLDGDQHNVDLKRQLQVIEQEANVLRTKTQSLELENEKLQAENKKLQLLNSAKLFKSDKSQEQNSSKINQLEKELKEALAKIKELESKTKDDKLEKKVRFGGETVKKDFDELKAKQLELDKMKISYNKMQKENIKLQKILKELKEEAIKEFRTRTPKKPTDMTTKLQMKKMVEELESEIGEMCVIMKNAGLPLKASEPKANDLPEVEEMRKKLSKDEAEFKTEITRLEKEITNLSDINKALELDKSKLEDICKNNSKDKKTMSEECEKLKDENAKLNEKLATYASQKIAVSDCMNKIEELNKDIDTKNKEISKLKKEIENLNSNELERIKLSKEVADKNKKYLELEKKCKELEDKLKKNEKLLATRKEKMTKLEKEKSSHNNTSETESSELKEKVEKAKEDLQRNEAELDSTKLELQNALKKVADLEVVVSDKKSDIDKLENEKQELDKKLKAEKKESTYWENKTSDIEIDLQAERKKIERMRISHDKDIKNKEAELATLKGKLKILEQTTGTGAKKIVELKQEYEESLKKLEHSLAVERSEYEELTAKYEILEEEHVVTKARLTVEKEQAQGDLIQSQKELNATLEELKNLQDIYEAQRSACEKDKADLKSEISKLEARVSNGGWEVERARLVARLEQRDQELRAALARGDMLAHQHETTRKEMEEMRNKLEDYEKVTKVHTNIASKNNELDKEISELKRRLEQTEKFRKAEADETKSRYEGQLNTMREELKVLQNQVSKFKNERDNYKQLLDEAQKSLAQYKRADKNKRTKSGSISGTDEEEYRSKMSALQQQVASLEDEVCEARLEASRLNTELVTERAAAEIKLAEMRSKLNEYEEERLLGSGRARVAGLATRMELAWHKEREEQQRLLHETSTLARDLRQTLFEMERERDKERLDMKRRIEQLKRSTEEETEEAKKKVCELQCDLLELRDAHAKLRTANEKLRRDRERHERDRDQSRLLITSLKRAQQEDDKTIAQLLETLDELMQQSPQLFAAEQPAAARALATPTPPRRNRSSKSRSRSGTPEGAAGGGGGNAAATSARLRRLADELRASRIAERHRRHQATSRRAMSTEPRDTLSPPAPRTSAHSSIALRAPSLKKRSISLEQTTKEQGAIWRGVEGSSVSSIQSLEGEADARLFTVQRDLAMDSRLSGGSTQSDVLPAEKKKKKGLFGKLKKLTKSRSIDDQADPEVVEFRPIGTVSQGSDSDMSAAGSKRDLRGRISDMFSRKHNSKTSNKDPSPEQPETATGSASRPLQRSTQTLERPSSRASSATPATKRKGK